MDRCNNALSRNVACMQIHKNTDANKINIAEYIIRIDGHMAQKYAKYKHYFVCRKK